MNILQRFSGLIIVVGGHSLKPSCWPILIHQQLPRFGRDDTTTGRGDPT
ncbi:hypothetical protein [Arthrobacter sp. CAN_C5]|nr:hypothetical protein [Arthrobacter sp. CAN_C5]MBP2215977.1 hypothetical protein [Arthrobacter sp. CAN_C5]